MQITIELPDDIGNLLSKKVSNLSQRALEALAIDTYQADLLSQTEISRMLRLDPGAVEAFLRKEAVPAVDSEVERKKDTGDTEPELSIAETLEQIRRICEEEDFDLEIPPRQNRAEQFVVDDVSLRH